MPVPPQPMIALGTARSALSGLSRALGREAGVLQRRPDLLWQQVHNQLQWRTDTVGAWIAEERERRSQPGGEAWVQQSTPPLDSDTHLLTVHHDDVVDNAVFSPDSTKLATQGVTDDVCIWDTETGILLGTLETPEHDAAAMAFSPDGSQIATVHNDGTVRLWDVATARLTRYVETGSRFGHALLKGHRWVSPGTVAFAPDGTRVLVTSTGNPVWIWDLATGGLIESIGGFPMAISPDGTRLCAADLTPRDWDDRDWATALILDLATGEVLHILRVSSPGEIFEIADDDTVAFDPSGTIIAATASPWLLVWNALTGRLIHRVEGGSGAVAFSPDGTLVITGGGTWDVRSGELVRGGADQGYSPDGTLVVASAGDIVGVFRSEEDDVLHWLEGHTSEVNAVAFSPNGRWMATASNDGTARIWDAVKRGGESAPDRSADRHTDTVGAVAYSPDGTRVATASWDGSAQVLDPETGSVEHQLKTEAAHARDEELLSAIVFRLDGRRVATGSFFGAGGLWDATTGELVEVIGGNRMAMSPDSALLATANRDVKVWETGTGELVHDLGSHSDDVQDLAFSPDGSRLASTGCDGTLGIWDPADGSLLHALEIHNGWVWSMAFRPDGSQIVTAGTDGFARIWDVVTGEPIRTLEGHTSGVGASAFSPDGTRIATASWDGTARIWDAATGTPLHVLRGHTAGIWAVAFSPSGHHLVTASGSRRVFLYGGDTDIPVLPGGLPFEPGTPALWRRMVSYEVDPDAPNTQVTASDGSRLAFKDTATPAAANPDPVTSSSVRVWDVETGTELAMLVVPGLSAISLSPNKPEIACGNLAGALVIARLVGLASDWTAS